MMLCIAFTLPPSHKNNGQHNYIRIPGQNINFAMRLHEGSKIVSELISRNIFGHSRQKILRTFGDQKSIPIAKNDPEPSQECSEHFGSCIAKQEFRQEKRAQRLTFGVRRPPGRVGVFHAKGWWPKSSCPPSKVCLPWVSNRGICDVPGICRDVLEPWVCSKKKFVRIFRPLRM